jgi:hypothetical protein
MLTAHTETVVSDEEMYFSVKGNVFMIILGNLQCYRCQPFILGKI